MKIEKGIPIPETRGRKRICENYESVMKELEVGDSFVATANVFTTLQSMVRRNAKRVGINIVTVRLTEDGEPEGAPARVRVWRVDDVQKKE